MPWSNQGGGGGGGQGPWGSGSGGRQPPDLEDLLRKGQDSLRRFLPGGIGGGRGIAALILIGIGAWFGFGGFYRVQPDEQGVELIFGKWVNTTSPGLRYNWPAPIGQVYTPKVTKVNRVEIGFRSSGDPSRGAIARQAPGEALMLTGDENIIDINFVVFWIIKDAGDYLFNLRAVAQTVKDGAESAMREVIGKIDAERARTEGRAEIEIETRELLQSILDGYGAGVQITQVQLQHVDPPVAVIASFRDVQAAKADKERFINEAEAFRNQVVPRAEGEASKMIQEAEAYKREVIDVAEGKAQRFLSVYKEYKVAPEVTLKRLYLETMEDVMRDMNKVIIDTDRMGGQGVVPYLPLPEIQNRRQSGGQS